MYSDKYGAHYHSLFGAVEESVHVFISAGLYHLTRKNLKSISILEMGLGTGLNVLLTLMESKRFQLEINYLAIESDPISLKLASQVNYTEILGLELQSSFLEIHSSEWDKEVRLSDQMFLRKINSKIEALDITTEIDLVYFDAFSPTCQPHLWEHDLHSKIYSWLKPGAVLVTYCTKGSFRRCLAELGYTIEKLNGPGKKREMLRATKPSLP